MRYVEALEVIDRGRTAAIRDEEIDRLFRRYIYCKKWTAVPPYEGGYDKQPKRWRDVSEMIERCIDEMNKYEKVTSGDYIRQNHTDKRAGRKANRK